MPSLQLTELFFKPFAQKRASLAAVLLAFNISIANAVPDAVGIEFWNDSESASILKANHTVWQSILDKYLNDKHPSRINRFDYAAVTEVDLVRLSDYLSYLEQFEPRQFNMAEQKAYWINLYNAKTVELVARNVLEDDISSIRQIRSGVFRPGPWLRKRVKISNQELSLDDIEHGILRPYFNDRRIRYVLSNASLGSPNLLKTAFTADNTEELIKLAEQQFLTHPRALRMDGDELILNEIFDGYGPDFAENSIALIDYLKTFQVARVARQMESRTRIRFEYDWDLNKP